MTKRVAIETVGLQDNTSWHHGPVNTACMFVWRCMAVHYICKLHLKHTGTKLFLGRSFLERTFWNERNVDGKPY